MVKEKKRFQLDTKEQFREAVRYLKESQKYIYSIVIIFALSTILGYFLRSQLSFLNPLLEQIIDRTQGLNTIEMIFFILQNNLQSALLSVLIGVVFGIFPVFTAIVNGVILGYVAGFASEASGFLILWRLLPHGIFELPAIFIAMGLGLKLGFSLFLPEETRTDTFTKRFYDSANAFLMIVIPLLIIAAAIEGILIVLIG